MTARKRSLRCTGLAALLSLAVAGPAYAVTLTSPSLSMEADGGVNCRIVNLAQKPIQVAIEILGGSGQVIDSNNITVQPGAVGSEEITLGVSFVAYCRFSGNFNQNQVRASIDATTDNRTIAIAPAN